MENIKSRHGYSLQNHKWFCDLQGVDNYFPKCSMAVIINTPKLNVSKMHSF